MCALCAWITLHGFLLFFFSFIIIFIFKILQDKQMIKTINDRGFWFLNDECFFSLFKKHHLAVTVPTDSSVSTAVKFEKVEDKTLSSAFFKNEMHFFYSYIQGFPTRSEWWSELSCWCCAGWWCLDSARHSILHYGTSICKLFPVYSAYAVSMSLGQVTFSRCIVTHWTPVALLKCIGTPLSPFRRKTITGLLSFCRINPHLWDFTCLLVMF